MLDKPFEFLEKILELISPKLDFSPLEVKIIFYIIFATAFIPIYIKLLHEHIVNFISFIFSYIATSLRFIFMQLVNLKDFIIKLTKTIVTKLFNIIKKTHQNIKQYIERKKIKKQSEQKKKEKGIYNSFESTRFWGERLRKAFPDTDSIITKYTDKKDIVNRLKILLKKPLKYNGSLGDRIPLRHYRGGVMTIDDFKVNNKDIILLSIFGSYNELDVKEMIFINSYAYYNQYVYIECSPQLPIGVNKTRDINRDIENDGYSDEVYGIYNKKFGRKKLLTTEQIYNNGFLDKKGHYVSTRGQDETRKRYLSRYNFLIAPHFSGVVAGNKYDRDINDLMNKILRDDDNAKKELLEMLQRLDKPQRDY